MLKILEQTGDMIFWSGADKTRAQLSALRMEVATRLGLRNPAEFFMGS
jgi:aspartyl-tRNA synthetase